MISHFLFPMLAFSFLFIPGSVLLYLISSKYNIKLSALQIIVLGSVVWNYVLTCGYIVGILSNLMGQFFIIFTIVSLVLLVYGAYHILVEKKYSGISFKINSDKVILLISYVPLLLIISVLTISHSIYMEFDAIFIYLPSAKSIIETGGLQYNYYKQSGLLTADSPAIPIMYAWLKFLYGNTVDFDLGIRTLPLTYVLLTALVIYLTSREIFEDTNTASVAMLCFLSMPIVPAIASNYSLYLDIPFTFLLFSGMFVLLKIYKKHENGNFWLFILGSLISLMLLEKDISYMLFSALLTLILISLIPSSRKVPTSVLAIASSLAFTAAYNILFIWDIFHFPTDLLSGIIVRQIPVFFVCAMFSLLLSKKLCDNVLPKLKIRHASIFLLPFIPVFIYLVRNLFLFGAVTANFPIFNEDCQVAINLRGQAFGVTKLLPESVSNVLRWDILFTSLSLGAIFLIPCFVGLFAVVRNFARNQSNGKYFLLLSFLLILLSLWSWIFYCSYKGPSLRRLYYFAPLFAIFVAKGVHSTAGFIGCRKSLVPRFVIFNSLALAYLWSEFEMVSLGIEQWYERAWLVDRLVDIADVEMLIAFALLFIFSFLPIGKHKVTVKTRAKMFSRCTRSFIPVMLSMLLLSLVAPASFNWSHDIQSSVYYVEDDWENDLYEVISYVDQKMPDDSSIITCYALPISYFTNHPVIEVVTPYGIMNLLTLPTDDTKEIRDRLIEHNMRYLLLPKPDHSHYGYFKNLSGSIPVLSDTVIDETPYMFPLKDFSKFRLFKVITQEEAMHTYRYLTFFENGWVPLNNYSILTRPNTRVILHASAYISLTITDDDQDLFWQGAKANPGDKLFLSSDLETKVSGSNSFKMDVNGTGNIVIKHNYETPQDWSSFKLLTFYLYGSNSSKPIGITFHTNDWQDYYHISVKDDFIGWKKISIPLDSFGIYGKPSWNGIICIEILLGNRVSTYYMDQIKLEGYAIGLEGPLPSITINSPEVKMVLSIRNSSLRSPALLTLSSYSRKEELTWTLTDGINLINVPADLLRERATLRLYYYQNNTGEELRLNYLGILSDFN